MNITIAEVIKRDLQERIQSGRPLPTRLTLPHLAEHYRVSATPVRQAVQALLAEGFLLKQDNGRLAVSPRQSISESDVEPEAELPESSPPDWETRLVEEILTLSLQGKTPYLREEAMAKRFGVGRATLRQTFHRLAEKGLLRHIPRCGWSVRLFNEVDMRAYLTAREALEVTALDLAIPHLQRADLEKMRQGNAPNQEGENIRLDNQLHQYFIEKSGNIYIQDFFERNGLYYTFLFDFAAPEAHVMQEMAAQHRAILDALLAQDWTGAKEALAHHIRSQRPIVQQMMAALADRAAATPLPSERSPK